jgi:hypothetical protein
MTRRLGKHLALALACTKLPSFCESQLMLLSLRCARRAVGLPNSVPSIVKALQWLALQRQCLHSQPAAYTAIAKRYPICASTRSCLLLRFASVSSSFSLTQQRMSELRAQAERSAVHSNRGNNGKLICTPLLSLSVHKQGLGFSW